MVIGGGLVAYLDDGNPRAVTRTLSGSIRFIVINIGQDTVIILPFSIHIRIQPVQKLIRPYHSSCGSDPDLSRNTAESPKRSRHEMDA
jgi:hypothetical protein